MSHEQQLLAAAYIRDLLKFHENDSVLEIGSCDFNGTVRSIFASKNYVGVDLIAGPTVDIVASGHEIDLNQVFDFSVSFECFEHNPYWKETLDKMISHTKDGGSIVLSMASLGRVEHGTSRTDSRMSPGTSSIGWDYYQNVSLESLKTQLESHCRVTDFVVFYQTLTYDLYAAVLVGGKFSEDERASLMRKLEGLNKSKVTIKNIVNYVWWIPLRILFRFIGDGESYQRIAAAYWRWTKGFKS